MEYSNSNISYNKLELFIITYKVLRFKCYQKSSTQMYLVTLDRKYLNNEEEKNLLLF